jgi:hypothetical protein
MTASSNPSRRDRKRRPVCPKKAVTCAACPRMGRSRQWVNEDEERGKGDHRVLGQGTEVWHGVSGAVGASPGEGAQCLGYTL